MFIGLGSKREDVSMGSRTFGARARFTPGLSQARADRAAAGVLRDRDGVISVVDHAGAFALTRDRAGCSVGRGAFIFAPGFGVLIS